MQMAFMYVGYVIFKVLKQHNVKVIRFTGPISIFYLCMYLNLITKLVILSLVSWVQGSVQRFNYVQYMS